MKWYCKLIGHTYIYKSEQPKIGITSAVLTRVTLCSTREALLSQAALAEG